jgi:hypothetical protein
MNISTCFFVLAVFATPFTTSLILLCVLFFVQGVGHGLTDLGKFLKISVEYYKQILS